MAVASSTSISFRFILEQNSVTSAFELYKQ